jgi:hypothetical protein
MVPLIFDDLAVAIIARRLRTRPHAALCLTLEPTYARRGAYSMLILRWTTAGKAERDERLLRWTGPHAVPVFITPRLWRYLVWHPLRVRGSRLGPLVRLLPAATVAFDIDLRQWEVLHPGIELPSVAA